MGFFLSFRWVATSYLLPSKLQKLRCAALLRVQGKEIRGTGIVFLIFVLSFPTYHHEPHVCCKIYCIMYNVEIHKKIYCSFPFGHFF